MAFNSSLFSLLAVFVISVTLLLLFRPVAFRVGLLDQPDHRKHHSGSVPLIGGAVMFIALSFSHWVLPVNGQYHHSFFAAGLILVIVGMLDDLSEITAPMRFIAQSLAAAIMAVWGGVYIFDFGELFYPGNIIYLSWLAVPITIFATVGVINAMNMMDGVDGLAGSVALQATLCLGFLAWMGGDLESFYILCLFATVLVAFLLFNWRFYCGGSALVFMGDAGSTFLGFVLTWFCIKLSQGEAPSMAPITAVWILGFPLMDTFTMMIRRVMKGRSPFSADREHFHHLLQAVGLSRNQTVLVILLITLVIALVGVLGELVGVTESIMFYAFVALWICHFFIIRHAWKFKRMLNRSFITLGEKS